MTDDEGRRLEERLNRLEERLGRIEERLRIFAPPVASLSPVRRGEPVESESSNLKPQLQEHLSVIMPPPLPVVSPRPPAAIPVVSVYARGTLEAQVGLKWAGWVGAIIVVIGAALGIKYAYDHRWFSALPPAARLALMSLGGFGLIAAGEIVYRRISAIASVSLFGAGVATLFVVSFAGYDTYGLYERDAAFVLMAIVTLVGAAVAMRGNLVSIAILSIIGGNVAPIILSSDQPRVGALLSYLLMLQVVALFLAAWGRSPKWWSLRGIAFTTLALWLAVPIIAADELFESNRVTVLAFCFVYAALFHGELIASTLRGLRPTTVRVAEFAVPIPLGERDPEIELRGIGVTFSMLVTAALTIAVQSLLRDQSHLIRGAWVMGLGAACLAIGLALPKGSTAGLRIGYRIQAAALLVVAIPVALSGVWITFAWATLAIAFALTGAIFNLGVSRVASVLVWLLALGHLIVWTLGGVTGRGVGANPVAPWATLLSTPIPAYFVLAALLTMVGHAIAALLREDWSQPPIAAHAIEAAQNSSSTDELNYETPAHRPPREMSSREFQSLASMADVLAAIAFVAACAAALPNLGITFAVICYAWLLIGAGQILRSTELHPVGVLLLMLAAGKWMFADSLAARDRPYGAPSGYRPIYNSIAAIGVAICASGVALLRVPLRLPASPRTEHPDRVIRRLAGFVAMLVLIWLATLEVDRYFNVAARAASDASHAADLLRTKQVIISIVWSIYAVGCVVSGFAIRGAGLRYFGLALFGLTVVKVMMVDLSTVQTGYRILSFLGLGLLLLATSVLYGKLSPILLREEANEALPG
jgi:uncharacterized membrane protein